MQALTGYLQLKDLRERKANVAQATLLGPTAKIVLVVLWMVVTVGIGSNWIYKISRQGNVGDIASARIVLSLTEDLRRLNLRFGILHVRDG